MRKTPPIPAELLALSTMTLATAGLDRQPHAAAVFFAAGPDLSLYFFSEDHSQHAQDLREKPRAATSIYPQCDDWREIRGLQMRGSVRRLDPGAAWETGWELYIKKFPFVANLKAIVQKNSMHDNRRGFGYKKEWNLRP